MTINHSTPLEAKCAVMKEVAVQTPWND